MIKYKTIRGPAQKARCKRGQARCYCDCGCMTPQPTDPPINLTGVTVGSQIKINPGSHTLLRNGQPVGSISPQHSDYICIDGHEYLGCDTAPLADLIAQARTMPSVSATTAGSTLAETAANEHAAEIADLNDQDTRNAGRAGYCTKCHTYCHGDCNNQGDRHDN